MDQNIIHCQKMERRPYVVVLRIDSLDLRANRFFIENKKRCQIFSVADVVVSYRLPSFRRHSVNELAINAYSPVVGPKETEKTDTQHSICQA
jgi:hypothetical protein